MSTIEDIEKSLSRMQEFNPNDLVREADLGKKSFTDVVEPAARLIDLYKRLSLSALQDFSAEKLNEIQRRADADFNLFQQILNFDVDQTTADRDQKIGQVAASYDPTFNTLHPLIAYSLYRSADFARLDADARATIQRVNDQAAGLTASLEEIQREAKSILVHVKETAAEAGVSQQALFFKAAAESHEEEAERWRKNTIKFAWITGCFALLSLFFHHIPWLIPSNAYEATQLAVSKVLVFAVLSFLLFLAARNFVAQKHNAVVNRHRQQALQTYKALVDAALDTANRDIVLTHAASCIFGPQPTGYTSSTGTNSPSAKSVVELLGSGMSKITPS